MKIIYIVIVCFLFSCQVDNSKLKLRELSSFQFRKSYNVLPKDIKSNNAINIKAILLGDFKHKPFYNDLNKFKVINNQALNMNSLDLLEENNFTYCFSDEVKYSSIKKDLDKDLQNISFELVFKNENTKFSDTLSFPKMTNVWFSVLDLNKDGRSELISINEFYVNNGYNYDLKIYNLN